MKVRIGLALALAIAGTPVAASAAPSFAVWLDGNTDPSGGGNGILTSLTQAFGPNSYTLVTTGQLNTPQFLNSFSALVVSRYGANFGTYLPSSAVSNIQAYVGSGSSQGGVAVFTNDVADNLYGAASSSDPFDKNLNQLFVNAVTSAAASGHGYIGEFNGAVQAFASNSIGQAALGFLTGNASDTGYYGPQFVYGAGPIGSGNPIDNGVTFPFTDSDSTTYLTRVTNADPNQVVDVYSSNDYINGLPAVDANRFVISGGNPNPSPVPEPAMVGLFAAALAGLGGIRRRKVG